MRPFHDSIQSIDPGIRDRLRKLDPNLLLTFSQFSLSYETGQPILYRETGQPIVDPCWYLWQRQPDGRYINVGQFTADAGFGHRELANIEKWGWLKDMSPAKVAELFSCGADARRNAKQKEIATRREDTRRANKKRIADLMFDGKTGMREAKPISYPGQNNCNTAGSLVLKDAKEDGWDLPTTNDGQGF